MVGGGITALMAVIALVFYVARKAEDTGRSRGKSEARVEYARTLETIYKNTIESNTDPNIIFKLREPNATFKRRSS